MSRMSAVLVAVVMIAATTVVSVDIMTNGPISSLLGTDQENPLDRYTVDIDAEVDLGTLCGGEYSSYSVGVSSYDSESEATVDGSTAVFTVVGIYVVSCLDSEGNTVHQYEVLADGEVTVSINWDYSTSSTSKTPGDLFSKLGRSSHLKSSSTYTLDLSISYADYIHYTEIYADDRSSYYLNNGGATTANVEHDTSYVDYDDVQDVYIAAIADYIESVTSGKSQQYVANVVLAFVQSLDYVSDSAAHGISEYWQFPLETLFLGGGDCEDTSILYCAIMKELGYYSSMVYFDGHMGTGVCLSSFTAPSTDSSSVQSGKYGWVLTYTDSDGESVKGNFYYGETTGDGWLVGQIPTEVYSDYQTSFVISPSSTGSE